MGAGENEDENWLGREVTGLERKCFCCKDGRGNEKTGAAQMGGTTQPQALSEPPQQFTG